MTKKIDKITRDRDIRIKKYNDLYMAEDLETGLVSYGETKDEAVQNVWYRIEDMKSEEK